MPLRRRGSWRDPRALRFRGLSVFGFATAGLVLGHVLSYVIAVPNPYHRDLILHRTGHDYLPGFGQVALMLLLAAIAGVVLRASPGRTGEATDRFSSLATRLALVQLGAFAGQELLERALSGSGFGDLVQGRLLLAGLGAQVAVAFVGAALLRLVARTADGLADVTTSRRPLPRPLATFATPASPDVPRGRADARAYGERAPPLA